MKKTLQLVLAYGIVSYILDDSGYTVHALAVTVSANPEVLISTGLLNHHSADPKTWGIEANDIRSMDTEAKIDFIRRNFGRVGGIGKDLFMAVDYSINRSNRQAITLLAPMHIATVIKRLTSDLDNYDILIRDGHVGDINKDGVLVTFELTEKITESEFLSSIGVDVADERDITEVEFEEELTEEDRENTRVDDLIADNEYNSRMLRGDYMDRLEA